MSLTSSLRRPAATLARSCYALLLLALIVSSAESADNRKRPYLLVQHQVYEEHQEVLSKDPSKHSISEERKDDEELFDFIKDYLFKRGGANKLRSRSSDGRAQFMGVNTGNRGGANAAEGKHDGQSAAQRYKMHIVKFRLVNGSHHAIAALKNAHGQQGKTNGTDEARYAYKLGDYMPQEPQHKQSHRANGGGDEGAYHDNVTSLTRLWGSRSSVGYRTSHPTHARAHDPPAKAQADAGMCELPVTTTRTTTTTRKTTTPTTTTRKTTTTSTTTTCAPTTVNVIGCDRPLPPSTTKSTTTTTTTTTSTTLKPYLHGHPYVVIKLHEVPGTRRPPVELVNLGSPLQLASLRKHVFGNVSESRRNASHHVPEYRSWFRAGGGGSQPSSSEAAGDGHQRKVGEKHLPRSRRIPEYEAETAALKREVAGNLMRVLRTIRELDSVAKRPPQQEQLRQEEETQEEEGTQEELEQEEPQSQEMMQPAQLEEERQDRDAVGVVQPNPGQDIDRLLMSRIKSRGFKFMKKGNTAHSDELSENRAEEGDLHQFSILLRKALDELNASPDTSTTRTSRRTTTTKKKKKRTTAKSHKELFGRR